jgi:hypothetical protein
VALERAGTAGVWLEAGAPISAGPRGPRRTIALRDPGVEVAGSVPAAFVGQVWLAAPGDDAEVVLESCMAAKVKRRPAAGRRKRALLAEGEVLRAAPDAGARELATLREAQDVMVIARGAAWAEVEVERTYVRIRGHVPASALDEEGGLLEGYTTCGGRGFGMSHADRIEVPVGTCLYDRKHGEVAGVAIEAKVRLGARGRSGDEWSMVYVDTRWSITSMYVRDTGRDPTQPFLESCTASKVRR